jgi:hypothetical protein
MESAATFTAIVVCKKSQYMAQIGQKTVPGIVEHNPAAKLRSGSSLIKACMLLCGGLPVQELVAEPTFKVDVVLMGSF